MYIYVQCLVSKKIGGARLLRLLPPPLDPPLYLLFVNLTHKFVDQTSSNPWIEPILVLIITMETVTLIIAMSMSDSSTTPELRWNPILSLSCPAPN